MQCPASMCPLIAPNGSPWTGEYAGDCPGHDDLSTDGCPWWSMGCGGGGMMRFVDEAEKAGGAVVLGPNKPRRKPGRVVEYECLKQNECRWQEQSINAGHRTCPPREAMLRGLDPRVCLF